MSHRVRKRTGPAAAQPHSYKTAGVGGGISVFQTKLKSAVSILLAVCIRILGNGQRGCIRVEWIGPGKFGVSRCWEEESIGGGGQKQREKPRERLKKKGRRLDIKGKGKSSFMH